MSRFPRHIEWKGGPPPTRIRTRAKRRSRPLVFVAMLVGLLVGGCGASTAPATGAGPSSSGSVRASSASGAGDQAFSAFSKCMRAHGVPNFPDPKGDATTGGISLEGTGVDRNSSSFKAAEEACKSLMPQSPGSATPGSSARGQAGWERIVPGGDCGCADGSQFNFWVRKASTQKVVFYLGPGGACFSAATCAPGSGTYRPSITQDDDPNRQDGEFDFADARNPFADYSVVFVPYCTGDVFIGNATTEYAPGLTVHHKGFVNGTAALDYLTSAFPGATDVVVMGESAGSVASPLYAGLVSDRLPDARVTVLADGSGSYPDSPAINDLIADAWGTGMAIPPWPENAGLTAKQWSLPGLFIQSYRHEPKIVFARHDYAYDQNQQYFLGLVGIPAPDLLSLIDGNEAQIEGAGVNLLSYISPGDDHTALTEARFYTEEVNGVSLLGWVTNLIQGQAVADVHCTICK